MSIESRHTLQPMPSNLEHFTKLGQFSISFQTSVSSYIREKQVTEYFKIWSSNLVLLPVFSVEYCCVKYCGNELQYRTGKSRVNSCRISWKARRGEMWVPAQTRPFCLINKSNYANVRSNYCGGAFPGLVVNPFQPFSCHVEGEINLGIEVKVNCGGAFRSLVVNPFQPFSCHVEHKINLGIEVKVKVKVKILLFHNGKAWETSKETLYSHLNCNCWAWEICYRESQAKRC